MVLVGKVHPEERHPVSRVLMRLYEPVVLWSLRWKWAVIVGAFAMVLATVPVYLSLGSEFMPPLDEESLLTCRRRCPVSRSERPEVIAGHRPDHQAVPEVDRVLGKPVVRRPPLIPLRSRCWRR
jgi:Cu(I)/Ag(I) efflux system membrane protein CusA/SilA